MPRPNQIDNAVIGNDPSALIPQGNGVSQTAVSTQGTPEPIEPVPNSVAPGLGFPPGLAPALPDAGLPDHLAGGSPATVTPAQAAALNQIFAGAPVEPADLQLAEHTNLKCPKCDEVQSASNKTCKNCGHDLASARKAKFAKMNMSADEDERIAVIYNTQGLNLAVATDDDMLWKVVCKTGTLALSPGPGQIDLERPLEITPELFDDMVLSANEQAFPYITVPETHANSALENTGYVRKWEVLDRDTLLADQRLPERYHELINADPEDTRYLLAGIDFTEPDVKEKAQRGTIPDTSIGVKFNYRNKRTGKLYKAAWEHVALTPMPWIDGLPAFGMSQQKGVFDQETVDGSFLGVYVPTDLRMATRVTQNGDDYDSGQARAAISVLAAGDSWNWNYDVTVQALEFADEDDNPDGTETGEESGPEQLVWMLSPSGAVDVGGYGGGESLLYNDIDKLMTAVDARVAECKARRAAERARYEGAAQPVGYSVSAQKRAKSKKAGHSLPDGSFPIDTIEDLKNAAQAVGRAKDVEKAKAHIRKRAKELNAEHVLGDGFNAAVPPGQDLNLDTIIDPNVQSGNLSVQAPEDGATVSEQDLLDLVQADELPDVAQASQENPDEMTATTAEQLLAQQQAELEASTQRIAELESRLESQDQVLLSQGDDIHVKNVNEKVQQLQAGGLPPALCLAARGIYLQDSPSVRSQRVADGDGSGLNLSVQVAKVGADGEFEERKLATATDIVDHLLASVPRGNASEATSIATLMGGLGELNASAHSDKNPEQEAKAKVDAYEKSRHPERFNEDGTRKAA